MTVLSKALTAETAEERFRAMLRECGIEQYPGLMASTIIEQFYTNERTLFIAAGRGELSAQGIPEHMNPPKDSDGGNTGADGAYKPGDADIAPGRTGQQTAPLPSEAPKPSPTAQMQPLGPHDAGWQGVCTVEQLEPFLGPHLGLKTPQFTLWCTFKAGFYPKGTAARLEALRKLTDRQRALLKEAGV